MRIELYGCTVGVLVILLASLGTAGCYLPSIDLEAKECPCSAGWICDKNANRCVKGGLRQVDAVPSSPTGTMKDAGTDNSDAADMCPTGTAPALGGGCEACEENGDRDGDRTSDCRDLCPDDPEKVAPGSCGCGSPDVDADQDGSPDCSEADGGLDAGGADAQVTLLCDPSDEGCMDPDGDGISSDGDLSGVKGDAPCRDGRRDACDDNCPLAPNPWQDDGDNDAVGDSCDPEFCRSSPMVVAVGYGDQTHLSTDHGQTWLKSSPGAAAGLSITANWEDVVYGRGTWIIDNSNGNTVTWARSTDGKTWTVKPFSDWQNLTRPQAVGYGDGRWYLGSDDGRLAVSYNDGESFASIGAPKGWNGTAIEAFAYHGGRLIAVGDAGQISYSDQPDVASSWHTQIIGSGDFKQIVVVAGLWVAAGRSACFYSQSRGEQWTSCGAPAGTYYGLHYSNGLWMIGDLTSGAWVSRGLPNNWTERVFASVNGATPVYGDCGSGRWFAGHRVSEPASYGLLSSEDVGRIGTSTLLFDGQAQPLYGITGN